MSNETDKKITFVDQTIRDAQQSLWGFLMSTDMIAPIAGAMDEVGYKSIATVGSNGFVVQSRYYGEDPWERIRLLSRRMRRTPLRFSYMTASLASFDIDTPREVIALWIKRACANGVRSFWICDYQTDMERFRHFAKLAKEEGAEVVPALMYSLSPVHDDAHWARKARLVAQVKDCVDAIMIEDASGVLTPERTRALVTTVQQNCDGIPLEFHAHCNSGLAPLCYLEAIQLGVRTVHTATAPLANGTSLPAAESILRNVRRLGYTADLDEGALAAVASHFRAVAEQHGFPIGAPEEYDAFHFEHQVPGGMITNLKRQLREAGMEHRLGEVLEEVVRVREELGYPVMATPFSQIVGVQAVENVVSGERYKRAPDTVIKYVMGFYGEAPGPVDPKVKDKILGLPEARKLAGWQPRRRSKPLAELRQEVGPELSDDELLLRVVIPGRGSKAAAPKAPATGAPTAHERPAVGTNAAQTPSGATNAAQAPSGFPLHLTVEVDGEAFAVKVSPSVGAPVTEARIIERPRERKGLAPGAVVSGMPGMIVALKVNVGDAVRKGHPLATIEAMKMIRELDAPHDGVVKEIFVAQGDTVAAEDPLMVVA